MRRSPLFFFSTYQHLRLSSFRIVKVGKGHRTVTQPLFPWVLPFSAYAFKPRSYFKCDMGLRSHQFRHLQLRHCKRSQRRAVNVVEAIDTSVTHSARENNIERTRHVQFSFAHRILYPPIHDLYVPLSIHSSKPSCTHSNSGCSNSDSNPTGIPPFASANVLICPLIHAMSSSRSIAVSNRRT